MLTPGRRERCFSPPWLFSAGELCSWWGVNHTQPPCAHLPAGWWGGHGWWQLGGDSPSQLQPRSCVLVALGQCPLLREEQNLGLPIAAGNTLGFFCARREPGGGSDFVRACWGLVWGGDSHTLKCSVSSGGLLAGMCFVGYGWGWRWELTIKQTLLHDAYGSP